ncbi:MAG: polysaccharide pyruvyl transferase family protein [Oligoflexia bacterium]|nr:polysaccharide pyruvyl transferase family protein [Oligoflexia bacterium]
MIKSITLLGSSSGRNAGDAALIAGIMDSIDAACGRRLRYEIPTINPNFVRRNYTNEVVPIGMMPWHASVKMLGVPTLRSILRTDLTLVFDAILFDRSLYNPLFNFLSTLRVLLPIGKSAGKRMGFFNVSAGPVTTPAGREMLRAVSELMDFVTVRDENSAALLRDIGVREKQVIVTADAALTMRSATPDRVDSIWRELGFQAGQEVLGINVSAYLDSWSGSKRKSMGKDEFLRSYSGALNTVAAQLGVPLLFVSTQHHDEPLTRELMALVTVPVHKALLSNRVFSPYDIRGVLEKLQLLFGMRLHATILASAGLTPVLALPHQPKVSHYFGTLGLDRYVLTFDDYSEQALVQHLLRGWDERARIREQLEKEIPRSRERAFYAAQLVAQEDARPLAAEQRIRA